MTLPITLDEALEYVTVGEVNDDHIILNNLPHNFGTWFYVETSDDAVIAYFPHKTDALRFRLDYINQILNPVPR